MSDLNAVKRAAVEARVRRMARSDAAAERVAKADEAASDWVGVCRVCGEKVEGSLSAFKEHVHGSARQS